MRGHLKERTPGVWLVRVSGDKDPVTGRRHQPSRVVHGTRNEAELALAELTVDVGRGVLPITTATIGFLFERWFQHAEGQLSPTTMRGYRKLAKQRILPRFGGMKLTDLTTAELDRYYSGLLRAGLNPRTVRNIHSVIRRAYAHALRWGWVTVNPATNTEPPSIKVPRREVLSVEQILAAIETAKGIEAEYAVYLRLAYATGARRGELCALRWTDLDPVGGTVWIARSVAEVDGGTLEKATKTSNERLVTLDAGTVAALAEHRRLMEERGLLAGCHLAVDAFMFSYRLDCTTPMYPSIATRRWGEVREEAGLPKWARLHDIRHAHASILIDGGVPIATVSERLGHTTQHITLNIYNHPYRNRDAEAATLIGAVIDQAPALDALSDGG